MEHFQQTPRPHSPWVSQLLLLLLHPPSPYHQFVRATCCQRRDTYFLWAADVVSDRTTAIMSSTTSTMSSTRTLSTNDSPGRTIVLSTATASIGRIVTPDRLDLTIKELHVTKTDSVLDIASSNGNILPPPARASPIPDSAILNGKPSSPLVATSNVHQNGGTTAPQTVSSKDPKAAAQAATDMRNIVRRKLTGYVGFANLPNQWHRKSVRKGFNFNVMVVGK